MKEHWEKVPIFGDYIKQKGRESEKKGRQEGMTLALQEDILEILNLRFGLANGPIARTIHGIDKPGKLKTIFRRVVKADSVESVKKMLAAEKASSKKNSVSRARR